MYNTIISLNNKNIFITKADKGIAIAVLDKIEYDKSVQNIIDSGPYKLVNNPLMKMNRNLNAIIKKYMDVFGMSWKYKMHITSTKVPRLYCLSKVHKLSTNSFKYKRTN